METKIDEMNELFSELLKQENNQYKYRFTYLDYFSKLQISDKNIEHLYNCFYIIKKESGTCRYHHQQRESIYEDKILQIIKECLTPLLDNKFIEYVQMLDNIKDVEYKLKTNPLLYEDYHPIYDASIDESIAKNSRGHCILIANNLREIYKLQDLNCIHTCDNINMTRTSCLLQYYNCMLYYADA